MEEADILVSCPYNPAHRIRKYKFMAHVAKCKKTSKTENKIECPLDKTHIVDRDRLKEHIKTCSSIGKLADMNTGCIPKVDEEPPIVVNSYNTSENWEEEPEVPPYDPMEVSAKKPVLRAVSGLTKSEKKKFKESERMRIANLKGFHSVSAALSSARETAHEAPLRPLRPPRDTAVSPTRDLQDDFNKSVQIHERDDDRDASPQASFVSGFHNDSFHRMYDELAPKDDIKEGFDQSLRSTGTAISLKDYFQNVSKENGSFSNRNRETNVKKTQIDTTLKPPNAENLKKEKDECIASTSSAPERVTDKLLALLKESNARRVQPVEKTIKIEQINKDPGEKGLILDEIYNQFNERLVHLRDIQNSAAEESARLTEQLKELKDLREEMALRK